jgi:hypothetical protein
MVEAEDADVFVTGMRDVDSGLLGEGATTDLRRWYAWIHELYALALSLFPKGSDPDAIMARLRELLYDELDPFLVPRVRHWAQHSTHRD